jgi:hypothetical protein
MTKAEHHRRANEIVGALRLDRYLLNLRAGDEISEDVFSQLVSERGLRLAAHIFGGQLEGDGRARAGLLDDALLNLKNDLRRERVLDDRIRLCELAARHVHDVLAAVLGHGAGRTTSRQSEAPSAGEFGATEIVTDIATNDSTIDPGQLGAWREFETSMARLEPELQRLVDLLFFDGLPAPAAADMLGLSEETVRALWRTAKVRLAMAGADVLPS